MNLSHSYIESTTVLSDIGNISNIGNIINIDNKTQLNTNKSNDTHGNHPLIALWYTSAHVQLHMLMNSIILGANQTHKRE